MSGRILGPQGPTIGAAPSESTNRTACGRGLTSVRELVDVLVGHRWHSLRLSGSIGQPPITGFRAFTWIWGQSVPRWPQSVRVDSLWKRYRRIIRPAPATGNGNRHPGVPCVRHRSPMRLWMSPCTTPCEPTSRPPTIETRRPAAYTASSGARIASSPRSRCAWLPAANCARSSPYHSRRCSRRPGRPPQCPFVSDAIEVRVQPQRHGPVCPCATLRSSLIPGQSLAAGAPEARSAQLDHHAAPSRDRQRKLAAPSVDLRTDV